MAWQNAEEASAVLSAYVLIETEVGKVAHVAQALSDLEGVQLAEDLAGPYDVIARVQAPGLDQLGRLVVSRIQVVDGIPAPYLMYPRNASFPQPPASHQPKADRKDAGDSCALDPTYRA